MHVATPGLPAVTGVVPQLALQLRSHYVARVSVTGQLGRYGVAIEGQTA